MKTCGLSKAKSLSFAKPMKDIISNTFDITLDELEYAKNKGRMKSFIKYRRLVFLTTDFRVVLQRFGTEGMKPTFGDNVWSDLLRSKMTDKDMTYIISDWRFPEEAKDTDIKIQVYNTNSKASGDTHVSENALVNQKYDYRINNNSTMESLEEKVKALVSILNIN